MLFEMLAVMAIVSVVLVTSARLFNSAVSHAREINATNVSTGILDNAIRMMRDDVWNGYEVRVGNPLTAVIRQPADRMIVWAINEDGTNLERTEFKENKPVGSPRSWADIKQPIAFEFDAFGLKVHYRGRKDDPSASVWLASQLRLNRGSQ